MWRIFTDNILLISTFTDPYEEDNIYWSIWRRKYSLIHMKEIIFYWYQHSLIHMKKIIFTDPYEEDNIHWSIWRR
jgi:hypothetical protein